METQYLSRTPEHGRRSPTTEPLDHPSGGSDLMPSSLNEDASTVSGVPREEGAHAGPDRAAAAARPPPGTLDLSIRRRGDVVELGLAGDLDMATAPRLGEAMALARDMATAPRPREATGWLCSSRSHAATIMIDTSGVDFTDAAGYRALQAALVGPDGLWDPRVVSIVGPAVAGLEATLSAASTPRARRNDAARRRPPSGIRGASGPRGPRTLARGSP